MCSVLTPGGQLLISSRADTGLYKLGTCGLEKLNVGDIWPNGAWPNTCGPHADGALFCAGKNCYLYNETTGEMGNIQYQKDYHYGGVMAYIDGVGAIAIGGASVDTAGGRIEILSGADEEREKWRSVSESVPTESNPDLVQLPVEYKWFTVTQEPHCLNPEWCNGLMLFGGYGCEAEDENCDFYQDSYVTYINSDGSETYKNTNWHNPGANGFSGRVIRWEMANKEGYRTIDSVLDRDSGFLVHAQTFKCKGYGFDQNFYNNTGVL